MRVPFISLLLLICIGVGLVNSCGKGKSGGKTSEIVFDSIVVNQRIPLLQANDTTLPSAEVALTFIYPVRFRDSESLARLQQIFKGTFFGDTSFDNITPLEATERFMADYTTRYTSLSNSYYEDKARLEGEMPVWYWYTMSNRNKILFQNDSLLSYAVEYSDYEGGAHGSYRVLYTNIDLNSLTTISEEDLFVPDYFKPLTDIILHRLMDQYNAITPDALLLNGFFTIEDIVPNNNFWINDEGLHYSYNQYEIAPYAMGVIDVTVPYSDLTDILLPETMISGYMIQSSR